MDLYVYFPLDCNCVYYPILYLWQRYGLRFSYFRTQRCVLYYFVCIFGYLCDLVLSSQHSNSWTGNDVIELLLWTTSILYLSFDQTRTNCCVIVFLDGVLDNVRTLLWISRNPEKRTKLWNKRNRIIGKLIILNNDCVYADHLEDT